MHRTFEITVSAEKTDELIARLLPLSSVMGLSVDRRASLKPVGDLIRLHVLNKGADEVLRTTAEWCRETPFTIATAEQASLIDPRHAEKVEDDVDEAIWEEMATGLRHQGGITPNFLLLMALGGAIATVGLLSEPAPQAIAFVAAGVISPGFEPVAKIALGLVSGRWSIVWRGLRSTLTGYATLVAAAALTFWLLLALGTAQASNLLGNPEVGHLQHPTGLEFTVSLGGALAGALIITAYRRSVIAGALMAMVVIHAAALVGCALVLGQWRLALEGLERLGIDFLFIVLGCGLVFGAKQVLVHRRKALV